jgi:hypothetical protein
MQQSATLVLRELVGPAICDARPLSLSLPWRVCNCWSAPVLME